MGKWENVNLDEVCHKITDGSHTPPDGIAESDYLMLSSKNVFSDRVTLDNPRYLSEKDFIIENKRTNVISGDVLLTIVGTIGRTAVFPSNLEGITFQRSVAILKPDLLRIDSRFLMYSLRTLSKTLEKQARGVAQKGIYLGQVKELKISLPPILTQKRIVILLDRASALIEKRKAQIEKLDLLVKSRFVEMFGDPVTNPMGWETKFFSELITEDPQNGLYKPQTFYTTSSMGTPIIRIDTFYEGRLFDTNNFKRLVCTPREIELYSINNYEIVINRVNSMEYLGKCALVNGLKEKTVFESNMMRVKLNTNIVNPMYVTTFLCSQAIRIQILKCAKKAVNQASINQTDVINFVLSVPPIELQTNFANFVERVEAQKALLQRSLALLERNYKSLMQKCFSGELF